MAKKNISKSVELAEFNRRVAASEMLDGTDLRVYLYLSQVVGFEEYTSVTQMDLAMSLDKFPQHISRSIRRLIEAGILIRDPEDGLRSSRWRFNPDFGT
jgi:hypothetical protein